MRNSAIAQDYATGYFCVRSWLIATSIQVQYQKKKPKKTIILSTVQLSFCTLKSKKSRKSQSKSVSVNFFFYLLKVPVASPVPMKKRKVKAFRWTEKPKHHLNCLNEFNPSRKEGLFFKKTFLFFPTLTTKNTYIIAKFNPTKSRKASNSLKDRFLISCRKFQQHLNIHWRSCSKTQSFEKAAMFL